MMDKPGHTALVILGERLKKKAEPETETADEEGDSGSEAAKAAFAEFRDALNGDDDAKGVEAFKRLCEATGYSSSSEDKAEDAA